MLFIHLEPTLMASKRGGYVLRNKDHCWGSGLYCTLYARTSFWHCQSCGVEAYISKATSECAVCMFQRLESANPGHGCQCTNTGDGGNRQLILETRAAQWRANITQNFAGNYIGLPQTVSGPIRAAWDQQEAELRAQHGISSSPCHQSCSMCQYWNLVQSLLQYWRRRQA